jgi:hypothetical protein
MKGNTLTKTKLVKDIMAPLVVACALLPMIAATASGQGTQGGPLQGTWEMQISRTDCVGHPLGPPFPSVAIFMAGGTMMESQAGTPHALKTPGEGVWSHTTDNNYAFRFKFFTFNTSNVFTGWVIIAGTTTVNATGDTNAGSATVDVYNTSGVLLAHACADISGTRFGL